MGLVILTVAIVTIAVKTVTTQKIKLTLIPKDFAKAKSRCIIFNFGDNTKKANKQIKIKGIEIYNFNHS
ncbi:Uncharacterised protein [Chlamydia trachomatis]|nr:Uncharacterised protein [Chlamydia trachomatis]